MREKSGLAMVSIAAGRRKQGVGLSERAITAQMSPKDVISTGHSLQINALFRADRMCLM